MAIDGRNNILFAGDAHLSNLTSVTGRLHRRAVPLARNIKLQATKPSTQSDTESDSHSGAAELCSRVVKSLAPLLAMTAFATQVCAACSIVVVVYFAITGNVVVITLLYY